MPFDKIGQRVQIFRGVIVEDTAKKNQRDFHIYCPELLPNKTGDITREPAIEEIELHNELNNQTIKARVKFTPVIEATYLGFETSKSVPTMWRGQQVLVLNFFNNDKFYWIPIEETDSVRQFEHIRFSCANRAITTKKLDDDNTYFLEIDTKYRKHVWIHLAPSDGESYGYDFKIDANAHSIELTDQDSKTGKLSNTIKIDSSIPRIFLQNSSKTSIELNDQDLNITVPRDMKINVDRDIGLHVKRNAFQQIDKDAESHIIGNLLTSLTGNWTDSVIGWQTHDFVGNRTTTLHNNDTKTVYQKQVFALGDEETHVVGSRNDKGDQLSLGNSIKTVSHDVTETITGNYAQTVGSNSTITVNGTLSASANVAKINFNTFNSILTIVIPSPINEAACQLKRIVVSS